jgi:cation-transporting ATPase 13A3/4/5
MRKSRTLHEFQKEAEAEDIDHLVDDIVPWQPDDQFVIAVSGKAFHLLQKNADAGDPKSRKVFGIMLERA